MNSVVVVTVVAQQHKVSVYRIHLRCDGVWCSGVWCDVMVCEILSVHGCGRVGLGEIVV